MKLFENLNEENFLLFAANNYRNKQCTDVEEFYGDLNRFKYIKRLLSRYTADCEELQERLLLIHLVIICNVFGIEAGKKMIWYKIPEKDWPAIKTMLVYLHYVDDKEKVEVNLDPFIVERLRTI